MLLPPADAARFLSAYKAMLGVAAGRDLTGTREFVEARNAFYADENWRSNPPTDNQELIEALKAACWGRFAVGRHLVRATEMIDLKNRVHRVRGLTTELREMCPGWSFVQTAVMPFAGVWICDGLLEPYNVHIGSNMRKEMLALIRSTKHAAR